MEENSVYNVYRYFFIPTEQITMRQMLLGDKKEIIYEFFRKFEKELKITKIINGKKHILFMKHKYSDDLYLCKYAKERRVKSLKEGETDIEENSDSNFPNILIIFDLRRQLILAERKTQTFKDSTSFRNTFSKWFVKNTKMYDHNFELEEITYEHAFWNYIDNSKGVYELELKMNSPNLFGGRLVANEILKEIKDIFNNTQVNMKFKNSKGKLNITRENTSSFIKYITNGGGSWIIKLFKGKKANYFKSSDNVKTMELPTNLEESKHKSYNIIENKLKKLNDIMDEDEI